MKEFLKSKLVLSLAAFIMIAAAIVIPLSGSIGHSQAQTARCGAWRVIASPNVGSLSNDLSGVAVISETNVWAVGNYENSDLIGRTLIEHWNGTKWSVVKSPNVGTSDNQLDAVAVVSASDIWAVGFYLNNVEQDQTLIEHWNGSKWSVVSSPNVGSGSNVLFGVAAVSASNIWAVGVSITDHDRTLIEHWNGSKWSVVKSPNVGLESNDLFGVAVVSASDIWAVGEHFSNGDPTTSKTLTEHWNGSNWSIVKSPNVMSVGNELVAVAALSANNVWAAGSAGGTLFEHWNGSKWSVVPSPSVGSGPNLLFGITAISASNIWAVGSANGTLIEHWNGSKWRVFPSPTPGSGGSLSSVAASSAHNVWAVGSYFNGRVDRTLTEFFC